MPEARPPNSASRLCKIIRYNSGEKSTYNEFELFEEFAPEAGAAGGGGEVRFLLAARKVRSKPSKYVISTERLDSDGFEQAAVVKLTSNYIGTRFKVYEGPAASHERHQLASIIYGTNVLGMMGPRKVKVLLPSFYPFGESQNLCKYVPNKDVIWEAFKDKSRNILLLQNKDPLWNEESRSYVLNFNGRVTRPSVKNFQLISRHDPDFVLIQFGRTGANTFSLDFREPASIELSFAIALSSIDSKLACE